MSSARKSLREEQVDATRERLVDAAMALLQTPGADLSMRSLARAAGISERTVYRYFANREQLEAAVGPLLFAKTSAHLPVDVEGLHAYVDTLFDRFEENRELTWGMVGWIAREPYPHPSRQRNLAGLRALIDRGFPDAPEALRADASAGLRSLVSGESWCYLRLSCELPAADVARAAHFAIDAAFARLRAG